MPETASSPRPVDHPYLAGPVPPVVNGPYTSRFMAALPPHAPEPPVGSAPGPERPWRRRSVAGIAAAIVALTSGVAGGVVATQLDGDRTPTAAAPATPALTANTTTATGSLAAVAAAIAPSVVTVLVDGAQSVEGSGVVVGAAGLIATNNHVVAGGGAISVRLADGRTVPATVAGTDPANDLVVLRATGAAGLRPAALGTSANLQVGDTVLAFGSPLGLTGTVTAGIVSAIDRDLDTGGGSTIKGAVQTDAPINSGSSGGPLVDTAGRVVGINTVIAMTNQDGGNIGLGFAIPAETVQRFVGRYMA